MIMYYFGSKQNETTKANELQTNKINLILAFENDCLIGS